MVVGYLNIVGISLMPSKAYPPLVVDPYAMLRVAVAGKLFQPIARRYLQIFKAISSIKIHQFFQGDAPDLRRKFR